MARRRPTSPAVHCPCPRQNSSVLAENTMTRSGYRTSTAPASSACSGELARPTRTRDPLNVQARETLSDPFEQQTQLRLVVVTDRLACRATLGALSRAIRRLAALVTTPKPCRTSRRTATGRETTNRSWTGRGQRRGDPAAGRWRTWSCALARIGIDPGATETSRIPMIIATASSRSTIGHRSNR